MTNEKWAPGPWYVRMSRERKSDVRGWREVWAGGTPVVDTDCSTITRGEDTWCEHGTRISVENANLIAAAPDLYEIVQRFRNYHDGVVRCDSAEEVQECTCAVCFDATRVISRARGETV